MTIKTPSREEVKRQLKRIRKEKKKENKSKGRNSEISEEKRDENVERLRDVVKNIDISLETQEQYQETAIAEIVEGEHFLATVDRISGAGNALVDLSEGKEYHINLGKVDCSTGDEVTVEITNVTETYATGRVGFVWKQSSSKPRPVASSRKRTTRVSSVKPNSTGLENRNDLLNGPQ